MQIKFKIGEFLSALDVVSMTVDKKGNLDTKDVLISAVKTEEESVIYMYTTDFINQGCVKLPVEVLATGTWPLNPNQLYVALSKRDPLQEAKITINDKKSVIEIDKSKFKLDSSGKTGLLNRLQAMPYKDQPLLEFGPEDLVDIFKRARSCVSTDTNNTNRYIMRGVHIKSTDKSYIIETTDGFSACTIVIQQDNDVPELDLIIPGEFTPILLNICSRAKKLSSKLKIIKKDFLYFQYANVLISTTIMTGKFPDINSIVNSSKPKELIQVDNKGFKSTVERVLGFEGFAIKSTGRVALQIQENAVVVSAVSAADCQELVEFEKKEDQVLSERKLAVGGQKLLDIINTSSLGFITIGIPNSEKSPLYIEEIVPDKLVAKYVVMPTSR